MNIVDERNTAQKETHKWAIIAKDKAMSGWGPARGGSSRVAWAVSADLNAEKLLGWVRSRSEMKNVTFANLDTYRAPKGTSHFRIYVTNANHPAFSS